MTELNIKQKTSENDNFLFEIVNDTLHAGRKTKLYICTCGYKNGESTEKIIKCPDCGAIIKEKFQKIANYTTFENNFISQISFTQDKGYIEYLYIEITADEDNNLTLRKRTIEINLEYVLNKKGVKTYKPRILENGVEHKWLKSTIENLLPYNRYSDKSSRKILDILEAFAIDSSYSLCGQIWNIHNKYKYGRNLLVDFFYRINGSIEIIKRCNELFPKLPHDNEEYMEMIKEDLMEYSGLSYPIANNKNISGYRLHDKFYNPTIENLEKIKKHTAVKKKYYERINDFRVYIDNYSYLDKKIIDLINNTGVEIDVILELFAHADRQSYELNSYFKGNELLNCYIDIHKIGLPIDWKPKEVQIYVDKMNALKSVISHCGNLKEFYDKYNLAPISDKDIIKTAYEIGGFKLLDRLLFDTKIKYYSKKTGSVGHCCFKHEDKILPAIFLVCKSVINLGEIYAIYTPDGIIEDKEKCKEYFETLIAPYKKKEEKKKAKGDKKLCVTTA